MIRIPQARVFEVTAAVGDWERHNAESLVELACRVPADRPFQARQVHLQLDHAALALVSGTPHGVAREEEAIAARPADAIAVYTKLKGDGVLEYRGARTRLRPGHVVVCDVDFPLRRQGFGDIAELAVTVPRASISGLTGDAEIGEPSVLTVHQDPYARALMNLVHRAVRPHVPVPADEQAVLELVAVLASGGRASPSTKHRAAARAFIDDHLADPLLSASDVAAGAGVSERHLSRLFAEVGASVPRHILARRLDLAYSTLRHAPGPGISTAEAAARCGFTSMSHFSRTFHQRFGVTAGKVRSHGGRPQPDRDRMSPAMASIKV
ncbi:helix-turn-helix domain-containing protein [Catenulispora rubra]|uniref:helix-turn-helix domain-containing protein n=1 Tax=Catenulispora rubra TaxID=280293 RepID=UPI00189229CC|nr:helix-turn-helix domain-containing protein [Catenulispora rubra]